MEERSKMSKAFIHTHSGLGDHICCYGFIKHLADTKYEEVFTICKDINAESLNHMYKDTNNITIFTMPDPGNNISEEITYVNNYAESENLDLIRIGFTNIKNPFHYSHFYEQIDVPYSYSWDKFPDFQSTEESKELYKSYELEGKNYALVINQNSYGTSDLKIDTSLPLIYMSKTSLGTGLFDWLDIIKNANIIHSVGTGPFHLVDRIRDFNKVCEFYFHDVRDDYKTIDTKLNWNYVEYEQTPYGYWRSDS
jgi:hypothetical protein